MTQRSDSQAFWELKRFYPWLGDEHLALLQAVYQTWRQLAEANSMDLLSMLQGIPLPNEFPEMTLEKVEHIVAFAREKAKLQEEETI